MNDRQGDNTSAGTRPVAAVILAAGRGTRMNSATPKVLHRILGRTMISWVASTIGLLRPDRVIAVIAPDADDVRDALPHGALAAVQAQPLGSGDALAAALGALDGFAGDVLVVNGDGVLFTADTMRAVIDGHRAMGSTASALAVRSDRDLPYGRVVTGDDGSIDRIVEAVDATADELAIRELNAGTYCFDANFLRDALGKLQPHNAQGELYLTDLFSLANEAGARTAAVVAGGPEELLGVNHRGDMAEVEGVLQRRILDAHMRAGVTFVLPSTSLVEPSVNIEPDALIEPGCVLRGRTSIAAGATVGPNTVLIDSWVGSGASVAYSWCVEANVGTSAMVGPFAYLRPNSILRKGAKAGTFVELKNTTLAAGAKVPHLSYIGDASIGEQTNIGAGTITANYRPELGKGKQRTTVGAHSRTGSDNVFVAPVTIGDDAFTGAGSIIVEDVPSGALAIARARQVNIENYAQRTAAKAGPDTV